MERALFLPGGPGGRTMEESLPELPRALEAGGFGRLYVGHETCEHGIPTAGAVRRAREACTAAGVPLTLVLPTVSDAGLARSGEALDALAPGTEVVFGDWGLLADIRGRGMVPVLGRLLTGAPRDPRLRASDHSPASLEWLRTTSVHAPAFQAILREEGVARVELDNLRQGLVPLPPGSLPASLLAPLVHVTSSRYCLGRFAATCGQARCPSSDTRVGGTPVLLWGVSTFHANTRLPEDPAALGVDRLVWTVGPGGLASLEEGLARVGEAADDLLRDVLDPATREAVEALGVRLLAVSLPSKDPTITLVLAREASRFHLQLHVPGSGRPHYRATARFLAGYGGDPVETALLDALVEVLERHGVDPAAVRLRAGLDADPGPGGA